MNREQAKEALATFKELLDEGLISQQDYDAKKQEIMELLTQGMSISPSTPRGDSTVKTAQTQPSTTLSASKAPTLHKPQQNTYSNAPTPTKSPTPAATTPETKKVSQLIEQTLADLLQEPVPWNDNTNNNTMRKTTTTSSQPPVSSASSTGTLATSPTMNATNTSSLQNVAVLNGHSNYVFCLALSPIASVLYSGSGDKTIKAWDLETLDCTHSLTDHENTVYALNTDDRYLYSGGWDSSIRVWDPTTMKCHKVLKGHDNYVSALACGYDYKNRARLYSGSWDMNIQVWDTSNFTICDTILKEDPNGGRPNHGHNNCVSALTVTNTNGMIASGSYDNTVKLWNSNYKCKQTFRGHNNWIYSIVTAGSLLFSASRDNTVKVWNIETGQNVATLTDHTDYVSSLALCGNRLYSGSMDKTIKVWDLNTLKCIQTLTGHTGNVYTLLATENTLVSGSWDKTIRIWQ